MTTTVLVVDDSASVRRQVVLALADAGFSVDEAEDGADGLEKVRNKTYAAVICDVNMPNMNGLDMLEALKQEPAASAIPVLMLTTEGQPQMIRRAKAAGAKGWIVKPFKPELLVAALQKITKA
jgi:two-component system chemotaxis response regulator CheY